jgi:hypothetical protein
MIRVFKNDESGYVSWLRKNKNGFVFNNFGGSDPSYNIIHKVDCRTLKRTSDEGSRTVVEKICFEDLRELEEEATRDRGSITDWNHCKICFPVLGELISMCRSIPDRYFV